MILRDVSKPLPNWVSIPDDDAPAGEAATLNISFGGNLDYYIEVRPPTHDRDMPGPATFRASTSGARNELVTSMVAALFKLGRGGPGDRESVCDILENVCRRLREEGGGG